MIEADNGILLIADPFLKDSNFMRTVVLLARHNEEGSFGFVLNRLLDHTLDELLTDLAGYPLPVYQGGPVQMDTVHYLHQFPDLIPDSQLVADDIYWGGDFEILKEKIRSGEIDTSRIKFFLGYSGWEQGQLAGELDEKTWITAPCTREIVFETDVEETWKRSLKHLGGKYEMMIHFPIDPQLN